MYKHRNDQKARDGDASSSQDGRTGKREAADGGRAASAQNAIDGRELQEGVMQLPLFPLKNVVLFPGMVLPLHIFELRYREMIEKCVEEKSVFGVLLIREGEEVSRPAVPHSVGTAARITRVVRLDDGHMNITTVGTRRFRVLDLDDKSRSYLSATVKAWPFVNGGTQLAADLAHKVRPRIVEYVELLAKASKQRLTLDILPEDPAKLAFLVGMAMQVPSADRQALLEKAGVSEMLAYSLHLLSREILFAGHMVDTQAEVMRMNSGPTGYIFPN